MSKEFTIEKKRIDKVDKARGSDKFYTLGTLCFKFCDIHSIDHELMFEATEKDTENVDNAKYHTSIIFNNGTKKNYVDEDKSIYNDLHFLLDSTEIYQKVKIAVSSDSSSEDDPEEKKFRM